MSNERAQAIYAVVQGFADVMIEEDEARQRELAVAWCELCDSFFADFPTESLGSLATYIGLALSDEEDESLLPGEVAPEIHAQVVADIFAVRALGQPEDEPSPAVER